MRTLLALALASLGCFGLGCLAGTDGDAASDDPADYEAESIRGGYVGKYNQAGQGHADVCVRMKNDALDLRYADGTPTGFKLTKAMLKYDAGARSGVCKDGELRLDARELLQTKDGKHLAFHRGGYGYVNGGDVKYGHVWIGDVQDHVALEPETAGNGAPCAASTNPATMGTYAIDVKPLPSEMNFCKTKGGCDTPELTNGYSSYGDPAAQGSGAASGIHYSYLSWSWINVAGGGVVRAVLPEGQVVHRCDVPSIKLDSVREDGSKNGWVRAIYVRAAVGDQWVYGWIVHSHSYEGTTVYHVKKM